MRIAKWFSYAAFDSTRARGIQCLAGAYGRCWDGFFHDAPYCEVTL